MCSFTVTELTETVPKIVLDQLPRHDDGSMTILVKNSGHPQLVEGDLRSLVLLPPEIGYAPIGQYNIFQIPYGYDSVSVETNFGRSKGRGTLYNLQLLLTVSGKEVETFTHCVDCGTFL